MPISWMRTLGLRENTNRAVPALLCVGSGWALGRPACGAAAPGARRTGGLAAAGPEQAPGSPAAGQSDQMIWVEVCAIKWRILGKFCKLPILGSIADIYSRECMQFFLL